MLNPNNFIANSDYPFDMVAKVMEGSFTGIGSGTVSGSEYLVPHDLPFTPLVSGYWSDREDFETAYPIGYNVRPNVHDGSTAYGIFALSADSKNIVLQRTDQSGGITYFYRVYCLAPGYLADSIKPPSLLGFGNNIFNSDLAYLKIAKEGEIIVDAEATSSTIEIEHNLGYIPFVRLWASYPRTMDKLRMCGSGVLGARITPEKVLIGSYDLGKIIYRIYADEA